MQGNISNIQTINTFFGININNIEWVSFFDNNGCSRSYSRASIERKIIKFLQNDLFAIVNMEDGRTTMLLTHEIAK